MSYLDRRNRLITTKNHDGLKFSDPGDRWNKMVPEK